MHGTRREPGCPCRLANELGAGNKTAARLAARVSVLMGLAVMLILGMLLFTFRCCACQCSCVCQP